MHWWTNTEFRLVILGAIHESMFNVHCYNIRTLLWRIDAAQNKDRFPLRSSRPAARVSFFPRTRLFCNAWLPENVLKYTYCFRTMNDVINICCALNIFAGNQNPFSAAHPCEQRPTQINVSSMLAEENTSTRRSSMSSRLSGKADWRLRLARIWLK